MTDAALAFRVLRGVSTPLAVVRRDGVLLLCSRAWTAPGSPVAALAGRTLAVGDAFLAALGASGRAEAHELLGLVRAVTAGDQPSGEVTVLGGEAGAPPEQRVRVEALRHGGEAAAVVTFQAVRSTAERALDRPAGSDAEAVNASEPDRAAGGGEPDAMAATLHHEPPIAAWIVSADLCRTEWVSPSYEALFGRPAEALALDPRDFLLAAHPLDRERVRERLWRQAAGTFDEVFRLADPSGIGHRLVRARAYPVHEPDGAVASIVVVSGALGIAEAPGGAGRERVLQTIVDGSPVGLALLDAAGAILAFNPALTTLLGEGRPLGNVRELLEETERAGALGVLASAGADERPRRWAGEIILRPPDGPTRTVRLQIAPLSAGGGVLVADDVSRTSRMEQQLQQAQRIESVGRLAGGVAHDFNNIMTVIRGHTDLLLGGMAPTDPLHADLEQIREAAERATVLTGHLLAFSRRNVLRPRVVDLNQILVRAEALLDRTLGEAIELHVGRAPGLGFVRADPAQLEQVLLGLVMNAGDAMPSGGRVWIRTFEVDLDQAFVKAHLGSTPGPHVALQVEDEGAGMDADTLARMFEPFFTTKAPGKGSGLGLAMIYGIVKQSGGYIGVESAPAAGSTFTIYLPRITSRDAGDDPDLAGARSGEGPPTVLSGRGAPGRPHTGRTAGAGSEAPDATGPSPGTRRPTILVAEDEPRVRALATRVLEQEGFEVMGAVDGTEALMLARGYAHAIDLLLTDIVLPGIGGLELAERLQAERPGLRVLFTSGYADDAVVRRGLGARELPFLPKPFSPTDLTRSVRLALGFG